MESPVPLAPDHARTVRRWAPSHEDPLVASGTARIGGPLGAHAAVGRARFSALRVLFALALVGLAIGWSGKTACVQQTPVSPSNTGGSGSTAPKAEARQSPDATMRLNWDRQRDLYSLCYTDLPPVLTRQHLGEGVPFWTTWTTKSDDGKSHVGRLPAPVGAGFLAYSAARATAAWQWMHVHWGVPSAISPAVFFNILAVVLALCWLVTIWALVKIADERRWAVWVAALSPVIFVHAFTSIDLFTVAFVMTGLLAWSRRRPILAGVLLGLGVCTGYWVLFVLLALAVQQIASMRGDRAQVSAEALADAVGAPADGDRVPADGGRVPADGGRALADGGRVPIEALAESGVSRPGVSRPGVSGPGVSGPGASRRLFPGYTTLIRVLVAAAATWLVVNLPVMIGTFSGWIHYFRFLGARPPEPDSVYGAIANLGNLSLNITAVNVISLVLTVVMVVAVIVVVLRSPRAFDVYSIAFLLVAGVLIASKVWSPQSTLWLVPLAVLAVKSSRILMAWMLVEALAWVPRMGVYLDPEHHWLPPQWYTLAVVVRLIAVLGVALHIVWQHYDVEPEPAPLPGNLDRSPAPTG